MNSQSKNLYSETQKYFNSRIPKMQELFESATTLDEITDTIYAIRDSVEYLENIRKELNKIKYQLEQMACVAILARNEKSCCTEYCCGTKRMSQDFSIPTKKKDPKRYNELMATLGIPQQVTDRELVRVHWPAFKEYCAELQERGENPPAGIDPKNGHPCYSVAIRKKKDILA